MHESWTKMTATGQAGTDHFPLGATTPHAAPVWATVTSRRAKLRIKSPELLRNGFALQKETEQAHAKAAARWGRQPIVRATAAVIQTDTKACGPHSSGRTRRSDQYACGAWNWAANIARGESPPWPKSSGRFGRKV